MEVKATGWNIKVKQHNKILADFDLDYKYIYCMNNLFAMENTKVTYEEYAWEPDIVTTIGNLKQAFADIGYVQSKISVYSDDMIVDIIQSC